MSGDSANSLIELARRAYGQEYDQKGEFDLEKAGLGIENSHSFPASIFIGGKYKDEDNLNLNAVMEKLGAKLIAQAQKDGVDIAKLAGVTDLDFNKNGELEPREVGAIFLAATMTNHVELGKDSPNAGKLVSELMGTVSEQAPGNLSKDAGEAAKLIAKQLLRDNGATIAAESDADFNKQIKQNKSVNQRDTTGEYRC